MQSIRLVAHQIVTVRVLDRARIARPNPRGVDVHVWRGRVSAGEERRLHVEVEVAATERSDRRRRSTPESLSLTRSPGISSLLTTSAPSILWATRTAASRIAPASCVGLEPLALDDAERRHHAVQERIDRRLRHAGLVRCCFQAILDRIAQAGRSVGSAADISAAREGSIPEPRLRPRETPANRRRSAAQHRRAPCRDHAILDCRAHIAMRRAACTRVPCALSRRRKGAGGCRELALDGATVTQRILRQKRVSDLTGLSRTTLWRLVRSGAFPAPRRLTQSVAASAPMGWLASEVEAWIATRGLSSNGRVSEASKTWFPSPAAVRSDLPIEVDDSTIEVVVKMLDQMEAEYRAIVAEFSDSGHQ